MGYTDRDPSAFKQALTDSYPFHPGIRDLYARFKENQGFQQTRALIRMMRIIVSGLWNSKRAESMHLIGAGDFEFTTEMVGELEKVNSKLEPAISADVEDSSGNSDPHRTSMPERGLSTQLLLPALFTLPPYRPLLVRS